MDALCLVSPPYLVFWGFGLERALYSLLIRPSLWRISRTRRASRVLVRDTYRISRRVVLRRGNPDQCRISTLLLVSLVGRRVFWLPLVTYRVSFSCSFCRFFHSFRVIVFASLQRWSGQCHRSQTVQKSCRSPLLWRISASMCHAM